MQLKLMTWCRFQKPNPWKEIGRSQCKKLLLTLLEPRPHARFLKLTLVVWFKELASGNMKAFSISYVQRTLLHQRRSLATWLLFLPNLGRWPGLRLKTPIPWSSECFGLCIICSYTLWYESSLSEQWFQCVPYPTWNPPTKVHPWYWQKNWSDLETSPCTKIWPNVDIHPMDSIQQDKKLQRLFSSPIASRNYPGRLWRLAKEPYQSSSVGSTLDVIHIY